MLRATDELTVKDILYAIEQRVRDEWHMRAGEEPEALRADDSRVERIP